MSKAQLNEDAASGAARGGSSESSDRRTSSGSALTLGTGCKTSQTLSPVPADTLPRASQHKSAFPNSQISRLSLARGLTTHLFTEIEKLSAQYHNSMALRLFAAIILHIRI